MNGGDESRKIGGPVVCLWFEFGRGWNIVG